jgi:hypothetical protein
LSQKFTVFGPFFPAVLAQKQREEEEQELQFKNKQAVKIQAGTYSATHVL